jgi:hypothetical protein
MIVWWGALGRRNGSQLPVTERRRREEPLVEPGELRRPEVLPHLRLDDLLAEVHGRLEDVLAARDQMHGLLEAVVAIGAGLELEATLKRMVETAVGLVDATYGALGVIGEDRRLAEFIPIGLDEDQISRIHHWPEPADR